MADYFDMNNYECEKTKIQLYLKNKTQKLVKIEDIKVGQMIWIDFMPFSQKYLDVLIPKLGVVTKVSEVNDIWDYQIKDLDGQITELFHLGVSYYGDSLGYDYTIYLIEE